jgi:hypothetical protein
MGERSDKSESLGRTNRKLLFLDLVGVGRVQGHHLSVAPSSAQIVAAAFFKPCAVHCGRSASSHHARIRFPRAGEFWLRNRRADRWKDTKQLEARTAEDDPLLAFLKSIDGRVLRPAEPAIEIEYTEVKSEQEDDDSPE